MDSRGRVSYNEIPKAMPDIFVSGDFDDLRSGHVRFLQEASKLGKVRVLIQPDADFQAARGRPPKFPQDERRYVVQALRYVERAAVGMDPAAVWPDFRPDVRAVEESEAAPGQEVRSAGRTVPIRVIRKAETSGFPEPEPPARPSIRKKVIVTGCFDWLHSGHIRFFEESAAYGDLHVDVGSDANIRLLKGDKHPLFPQAERLYMVRAVRAVARAFIGSGTGWMDAAPDIELLKPDYYIVNEDGDRPEKRAFCLEHGIAYVVLKRVPKNGLPRRDSTRLRGF